MSNQNFKVKKGIDAGDIVNAPVFNSTVATGTAPLTVASTTVVPNLNADLLDGYHTSALPISTATQTSLDLKAPLASPALTGTPTAPTATAGTSTTQLATTAFVTASPVLAGTPTAPTAAAGTNTTQLATTAFVTTANN